MQLTALLDTPTLQLLPAFPCFPKPQGPRTLPPLLVSPATWEPPEVLWSVLSADSPESQINSGARPAPPRPALGAWMHACMDALTQQEQEKDAIPSPAYFGAM